ncbi:hypothetical protein HPB52_004399 [Rhipicephalus sanguineus]|uniref:HTH CENPB-type domain-containing protein n=1 Tax=Rhipicephalus sanguineus TaxID=34632 RepID=A0A9D4Q5D1_RHISA|nr:hypothetical protein HPB52_004399 [Rhipicephalus sanguineus]
MPIAGAGAKKKRKQFSLQEKVDLFKEIDAGKKQIDLCRERGIAPSTLATILKDREKVLKLHRESQLAPTRKRLRLGNFQDVDQAVLTRFKDARLQNVPVSGPMLQEKAREFADALEVTGFDASSGWLFRFRQRNGITWQRLIINLCLKQRTSINVRQAVEMLTGAWWNVKMSTISNCWRKAGLRKAPEQLEDDLEENHSTPGDLLTEVEVEELLPDVSSFDDYVESDCAALTSADLTTEEIVNSVHDVSSDDDDPKDEESTTPNTEADESVTHSDVLVHMDKVRTYIGRCSDVPDEVLRQVEVGNVAALTVCAHFFEEGLELRLLVLLEFLRGLTGRTNPYGWSPHSAVRVIYGHSVPAMKSLMNGFCRDHLWLQVTVEDRELASGATSHEPLSWRL